MGEGGRKGAAEKEGAAEEEEQRGAPIDGSQRDRGGDTRPLILKS